MVRFKYSLLKNFFILMFFLIKRFFFSLMVLMLIMIFIELFMIYLKNTFYNDW